MTDAELLGKVKTGLGITGDFHDATLLIYIADVKAFMQSAGVSEAVTNSEASVGCILRGVSDLWNYGSGGTDFSPYFTMRVIQLSMKGGTENG